MKVTRFAAKIAREGVPAPVSTLSIAENHATDLPIHRHDRGEADGQLWIHMKYVAGQDAAAALRTGGPASPDQIAERVGASRTGVFSSFARSNWRGW